MATLLGAATNMIITSTVCCKTYVWCLKCWSIISLPRSAPTEGSRGERVILQLLNTDVLCYHIVKHLSSSFIKAIANEETITSFFLSYTPVLRGKKSSTASLYIVKALTTSTYRPVTHADINCQEILEFDINVTANRAGLACGWTKAGRLPPGLSY